jgi:nucleotide-binding universal stress UspA family protein
VTDSQQPATGEWQNGHSPVVVGVDGSQHNAAAVRWAADEAAQTGADLVLVTALHDDTPHPLLVSRAAWHEQVRRMLDEVVERAARTVPPERITSEVVDGRAGEVLLTRFPQARLIVLGKRGLGSISRLLVGSTSLAVAGRSHSVVAVVPDTWTDVGHTRAPIVVGVDPYRSHHRVLHLAFRRAQRLDVPLVAVHGWETPGGALVGGAADERVAELKAEARAEFDKVIGVWEKHFPRVRLSTVRSDLHPATAILEAAERAQTVVLGRHAGSRFSGFGFGSVTRAVLHYSSCPVMVVPTDEI